MRNNTNNTKTTKALSASSAVSEKEQRNSTNKNATFPDFVDRILPCDVLLGRGTGSNEHEGNRLYRTIIAAYNDQYWQCSSHQEKDEIARKVVAEVKKKNGRFLDRLPKSIAVALGHARMSSRSEKEKDKDEGENATITPTYTMYVVDDSLAIKKTKQAFRYSNKTREISVVSSSSPSLFASNNKKRTAVDVPGVLSLVDHVSNKNNSKRQKQEMHVHDAAAFSRSLPASAAIALGVETTATIDSGALKKDLVLKKNIMDTIQTRQLVHEFLGGAIPMMPSADQGAGSVLTGPAVAVPPGLTRRASAGAANHSLNTTILGPGANIEAASSLAAAQTYLHQVLCRNSFSSRSCAVLNNHQNSALPSFANNFNVVGSSLGTETAFRAPIYSPPSPATKTATEELLAWIAAAGSSNAASINTNLFQGHLF